MATTKSQQKAVNKYMKKMYDSLRIVVPKGQKSTIEKAAKEKGESINEYTKKALLARLGLESWPEIEDKESGPDA